MKTSQQAKLNNVLVLHSENDTSQNKYVKVYL